MIDLSIVIPAIRPHNWQRLYESIVDNCKKYTFELILISPYNLPSYFDDKTNVRIIRDFGCPSRCMNIGAAIAEGKFITWSADDGVHCNNCFDKALDMLYQANKKNYVVVCKYSESNYIVHNDDYYRLNNAYPASENIDPNWWIFNLAYMDLEYYIKLGGVDSDLQTSAFTLADLAARAYRSGCEVDIIRESTVHFDWFPADTGDHKPVFIAHHEDLELYQKLQTYNLSYIPYKNWKKADKIWKHRWT